MAGFLLGMWDVRKRKEIFIISFHEVREMGRGGCNCWGWKRFVSV